MLEGRKRKMESGTPQNDRERVVEGERRGLEQQEKDLEFLQNLPTVNMAK